MSDIRVIVLDAPEKDDRQALRYAGVRGQSAEAVELLRQAEAAISDKLSYRVCFRVLPLSVEGDECIMADTVIKSRSVAELLCGCDRAVVFAATVGVGFDREVARLSVRSAALAHMADALASERIESLCDRFSDRIKEEYSAEATRRFSPGYGDLPLQFQEVMFRLLSPEKHIGLSLTSSLLMTPTKSVSAVFGLRKKL